MYYNTIVSVITVITHDALAFTLQGVSLIIIMSQSSLPLPFEPQNRLPQISFWKMFFPSAASGFSREIWRNIMVFRKVNVFTKNILRHFYWWAMWPATATED